MFSFIRTCEISIYPAKLGKSHLQKILSDHGGSLETWFFGFPIIMALSLIFPYSLGNIAPLRQTDRDISVCERANSQTLSGCRPPNELIHK